ncbi:MAG: NAD-dependent deacylase [Desulfobacterales bacterium]|nr:NAD-dependent deacylase [Desulfobacterales bacterium]
MDELFKKAALDIKQSKNIVGLTGAGISVESGIPPFRGKGGVWEKFDPMEYATIDAFMSNPSKVWKVLLSAMKDMIEKAKPNDGHNGLFELEKIGKLKTIITQNVDGLHQMAGNTDVIEFHGNFVSYTCLKCKNKITYNEIKLDTVPPRCKCSGIYRPDCIFFGEMIPPEALWRSKEVSSKCDLMIVIGTSAVVQPASFMPIIAKNSGAKIIEINPERTPLSGKISDYIITGGAGEVMRKILKEL